MKFLPLSMFILSVAWIVVADVSVIDIPVKSIEDEHVSSKVSTEVKSDKLPTAAASPQNPETISSKLPGTSSDIAETVSTELPSEISDESALACGAAGSCKGFGGDTLCHDRCKQCSGPSGKYKRGACCGTLWLTCCCYYS